MYRNQLIASAALALLIGQAPPADAAPSARVPIVVDSAEALVAALVEANAGRRINLLSGDYEVDAPLVIPDGVTLEGEGVMLGRTRPTGFEPGTETRIVAAPGFAGDLLTLNDGVALKGLTLEYAEGSSGNVVAIGSRAAGDSVAASIVECEITNPNPSGIGPQGPTGKGVLVIARNPNLGADPPPHEDAALALRMQRSIVRSTGGGSAVFTISFAARSLITVDLRQNFVGGSLQATAGVSRPDAVWAAMLVVRSEGNVYSAPEVPSPEPGWQIYGGSGVPIPLPAPSTQSNTTQLSSTNDRIEGFSLAVLGIAGVRHTNLQGPSNDNRVDLRLRGLVVQTPDQADAADFELYGAWSPPGVAPGTGNAVRVLARGTTGSGYRQNVYADTFPDDPDAGNRLEFIGNAQAFDETNAGIDPAPSGEFFAAGEAGAQLP